MNWKSTTIISDKNKSLLALFDFNMVEEDAFLPPIITPFPITTLAVTGTNHKQFFDVLVLPNGDLLATGLFIFWL